MSTTDDAKKRLLTYLIMAFWLQQSDIRTISTLIATARIDSMKASYQQASDTIGTSVQDWEPPGDMLREIQEVSEKDAETIAETYKDNLENAVTSMIDTYEIDHGTIDGAETVLRGEIATWVKDRSEWKSEQIANLTCGSGANDGIDVWVEDLQDGVFGGIHTDNVEIVVLPLISSSDVCSSYAGMSFSISDAKDLPSFPVHPNCSHRKCISLK